MSQPLIFNWSVKLSACRWVKEGKLLKAHSAWCLFWLWWMSSTSNYYGYNSNSTFPFDTQNILLKLSLSLLAFIWMVFVILRLFANCEILQRMEWNAMRVDINHWTEIPVTNSMHANQLLNCFNWGAVNTIKYEYAHIRSLDLTGDSSAGAQQTSRWP